jgi:hypothetical protein
MSWTNPTKWLGFQFTFPSLNVTIEDFFDIDSFIHCSSPFIITLRNLTQFGDQIFPFFYYSIKKKINSAEIRTLDG